jgi:hypothetical protein
MRQEKVPFAQKRGQVEKQNVGRFGAFKANVGAKNRAYCLSHFHP